MGKTGLIPLLSHDQRPTPGRMESQVFYTRPGIKASYPAIKSSWSDKKGPSYRAEIAGIVEQVKKLDQEQQQRVLKDLGIVPIWYKKYTDIPKIITKILA